MSLLVPGCGAAPVVEAPAPRPIVNVAPPAPTAEPSSGCISREARAALEACAGELPEPTEGKHWSTCGEPFEAIIAADPGSPRAADAAYASGLCYQKADAEAHRFEQQQRQKQKQKKSVKTRPRGPRELTEAQRGMINAWSRYLCVFKPAAADKVGRENLIEVAYARARAYFEVERWEEAAVGFRDLAMRHADADVGIYAAQLYLEALNMLGSSVEPPRPACYDDMAADVPRFVELYCTGDRERQNADSCDVLRRILRDIARSTASGR